MKKKLLKILLVLILFLPSRAAIDRELPDVQAFLTNLINKIPPRPHLVMTGSEFSKSVSAMDESEREQAILSQLIRGNLPDFLRRLKPVQLFSRFKDGKTITATIFVMPDYLAIGPDRDFLPIPMGLHTATEIAIKFGFILPTKKMVDTIFKQSDFHYTPDPLPPGPQMRSMAYYLKHAQKIEEQRRASGYPLDALVSGHKKDVVLTNRLTRALGKIAIYGWHRLSGIPIQPLSTVHRADYADYSHGIRLISDTVLIDGEPRSIYEVLEDPRLATILSDEGPIRKGRQLMTILHQYPVHPVLASF
jgi:hypothetical protein